MPVIRPSDTVTHEMHGARFVSHATPGQGSGELCAWRGEIPPGTRAPVHRVSREEVLHVLAGTLEVTLDGEPATVTAGDTVIVNAGCAFGAANPAAETAVTWVTTSVGLEAELPDGSRITPPWTRAAADEGPR
ncbi:cupin domain-containing protein [Streptomyces sp. NPDC050560]|uniref:cupin domain-containing protein n=1 Tax=Streptomyces sp. NPDC050560 TaxID=3365630 RepID=UPI0037BD1BE8